MSRDRLIGGKTDDGRRIALAAHDEVLRAGGSNAWRLSSATPVTAWLPRSPRRSGAVDAAVARAAGAGVAGADGWRPVRPNCVRVTISGTVLNRAARVMAAGHGGQILVAESTAVLLTGVDLLDLGPRRLRDVSAPVGVFQVRAPGICGHNFLIAWSRSILGNLRPAITRLIGRDAEVSNLQAALRWHRLVHWWAWVELARPGWRWKSRRR